MTDASIIRQLDIPAATRMRTAINRTRCLRKWEQNETDTYQHKACNKNRSPPDTVGEQSDRNDNRNRDDFRYDGYITGEISLHIGRDIEVLMQQVRHQQAQRCHKNNRHHACVQKRDEIEPADAWREPDRAQPLLGAVNIECCWF